MIWHVLVITGNSPRCSVICETLRMRRTAGTTTVATREHDRDRARGMT